MWGPYGRQLNNAWFIVVKIYASARLSIGNSSLSAFKPYLLSILALNSFWEKKNRKKRDCVTATMDKRESLLLVFFLLHFCKYLLL